MVEGKWKIELTVTVKIISKSNNNIFGDKIALKSLEHSDSKGVYAKAALPWTH